MDKKIRLIIGGMTCVNCQDKIEKTLVHTDGIVSASVSYNSAAAEIVYDEGKISLKEIVGVVERLGYEAILKKKTAGSDVRNVVWKLAVIVSLYIMLQSTGILTLLVPGRLADSKMGYWMFFVIGLSTSVHCIAMCGGINLSQCLPRRANREPDDTGMLSALRPALSYNMGRVLSYTAIGFILGTAGFMVGGGKEVGLSVFLQGVLKMTAGLFMVVMGINMLGLFPRLRKFTVRVPRFLARKIDRRKAKTNRPFYVGVLNGFMPCGPLQSMWIVALASGSPLAGAFSMFLFSLGTVPLMLGLGSIVSALGRKFTDECMTVGAVLVAVLGLALIAQGGSLSGWFPPDLLLVAVIALCAAGVMLSIPFERKAVGNVVKFASLAVVVGACVLWSGQGTPARKNPVAENNVEIAGGKQTVRSTLQFGRYPNITVQAGIPVKWVIDAPEGSINGCNDRIVIPDYGVEYTFHTGENVIEFTPDTAGTVRYSCWMGMIRGNIFVTGGTEDGIAASGETVSVPTRAGYRIPTEKLAMASLSGNKSGNVVQEVSIELTDGGFIPAVIVAQRGLPLLWNIKNSMAGAETGTDLLAPYYSKRLTLGAGVNRLSLYPTESFDVSTGDNRFYVYVKVLDDLSAADEAAIRDEVAAYEPLIYPPEVFERPRMSCCG